jgi:hypothetical protein
MPFEERNLAKAGYEHNPLEDNTLDGYTVITAPMTSLTKEACKDLGVKPRDAERSKNFFALGARVVAVLPARRADHVVDPGEVQGPRPRDRRRTKRRTGQEMPSARPLSSPPAG